MELWKPIKDYETYSVSTNGQVKNSKGKILKLSQNKQTKYLYLNLCKNSKPKKYTVHRLVCEAFVDNPDNRNEVDHIDGCRTNNNVTNLRWCTHAENCRNKAGYSASGMKGVRAYKGKFQAYIKENDKYKHLGTFDKKEDAGEAYSKMANELFKEFATLRQN